MNSDKSQGMDVNDIKIVVQYKATTDFCTLWQRFGRAARASGATADAILLVENKDTSYSREKSRTFGKTDSNPTSTPPVASDSQTTLSALKDVLNSHYTQESCIDISSQPTAFKKARAVQIGSPLDHFINIPNGVNCR